MVAVVVVKAVAVARFLKYSLSFSVLLVFVNKNNGKKSQSNCRSHRAADAGAESTVTVDDRS